tara:strand:- start:859 stop:3018 length:2160 start_codon:yes stop_codon:yes gene_type:complete
MAKRKYSDAEDMKKPNEQAEIAYVTWGSEAERKDALLESGKALEEYRTIGGRERTSARSRQSFKDLDTNVSGRPGFLRSDYDAFRPDEAVPGSHAGIIRAANSAYQRVGLIRNIIDLMGDFACQGIRLTHPNKRIEKFYTNWFKRVNGKERSERFLNNLYRTGNVVVRKQTAKINAKSQKQLFKTFADPEIQIEHLKIPKKEIPWNYIFLDPSTISVIGGELSAFIGAPKYAIKIPTSLKKIINSPRTDVERKLISQLPKEIIEAANSGKAYPLPEDRTLVFNYKKDDWQAWAHPMIHAILDDVFLLEKLKLADIAALDGAISNIRIFKLGNLEHKIAPTPAAASKLADILENHVGGGTTDLVWGPDIELVESRTAVHQFLGQEKYVPTLNAIYAGLGIPPTLTGLSSVGGGFTNNFMSLKTLVERLEYGRNVLISFWEHEILEIQKSMGFRFPAHVEFDKMTLANEDSEKALLIQMADRNLISEETLQRKFGDNPEMEKIRINRETKDRDLGRKPTKSGPYHDANGELGLKKIALQTQVVTPSEVGVELNERKDGEESGLELRNKHQQSKNVTEQGPSGAPQQGRPKNSKDNGPRKTKTVNPRSRAILQAKAKSAQEEISKILNPLILDMNGKKNFRSLSTSEFEEAERIKFSVLFNLDSFSNIDPESVRAALKHPLPDDISMAYSNWLAEFVKEVGRNPTTDECRHIQTCLCSEYKS